MNALVSKYKKELTDLHDEYVRNNPLSRDVIICKIKGTKPKQEELQAQLYIINKFYELSGNDDYPLTNGEYSYGWQHSDIC